MRSGRWLWSEEIVEVLLVIGMDQFHHSVREDRGARGVENVPEGHFRCLVFVESDFGVIDELDVLELGLFLEDDLGGSDGGVGGHLQAAQAAGWTLQLPLELAGTVPRRMVSENASEDEILELGGVCWLQVDLRSWVQQAQLGLICDTLLFHQIRNDVFGCPLQPQVQQLFWNVRFRGGFRKRDEEEVFSSDIPDDLAVFEHHPRSESLFHMFDHVFHRRSHGGVLVGWHSPIWSFSWPDGCRYV